MKNAFALLLLTLLFIQCEKEVSAIEESSSEKLLSEKPSCSTSATVKDLTGLDGCRFIFVLGDGTRLEPLKSKSTEDPLYNFEFVDGKKVFITYEVVQAASICMTGKTVKITCIDEAVQVAGG